MIINAPSLAPRLDFDALCASYSSSLVTKLRGHGAEADGLELWVPDEDPLTSFRNLLDAAASVGRREISLWISTKSATCIDVEQLRAIAAAFGRAEVTVLVDASIAVDVYDMKPPAAAPRVARAKDATARTRVEAHAPPIERRVGLAPCYETRVGEAAAKPQHRGRIFEGGAAGEIDGRVLSLELDGGTIVRAMFSGAKDDVETGVLETLCGAIEGLPLDEAADHGAIRAEAMLRDARERPVAGIVTPRAAGEVFALAEKLVRKARASQGAPRARNEYDNPLGDAWKSASEGVRRDMLARAIETFCRARGANAADVEVTAIEHDVRVVVTLPDALPANEKPKFAFDLERAIRRDVEPRLELYAEELKDKNKLRRLAVVTTGER
jgi:hypothetical protein